LCNSFFYVIKIIAVDAIMPSAEDVILVGERCHEKCVEMHTRNSAI
jgi:hypothetical protein